MRDTLYVADCGNHAVRRINLRTGDIDTLCGNGRRGAPDGRVRSRAPQDVMLDSPRAVAAVNDQLHIALTGDNQVWSYDLGKAHAHAARGLRRAGRAGRQR